MNPYQKMKDIIQSIKNHEDEIEKLQFHLANERMTFLKDSLRMEDWECDEYSVNIELKLIDDLRFDNDFYDCLNEKESTFDNWSYGSCYIYDPDHVGDYTKALGRITWHDGDITIELDESPVDYSDPNSKTRRQRFEECFNWFDLAAAQKTILEKQIENDKMIAEGLHKKLSKINKGIEELQQELSKYE